MPPTDVAGRPWLVCRLLGDAVHEYEFAVVSLTAALARRLLAYRPLLAPLAAHDGQFYSAEFFDRSAQFGGLGADAHHPDNGEWGQGRAGDTFVAQPVAASVLRAMPDGVLWAASPKHSGGHLETETLFWADLEAVAAGGWPYEPTEDDNGI